MRIFGENERSYRVLQEHIHYLSKFTHGPKPSLSPRINGQRGELVLSYAANLLTNGNESRAAEELGAWQPLNQNEPSTMELDVAHQKHVMLGRVLRNQGRFDEAIVHYELLLCNANDSKTRGRHIWQSQLHVHLSDLYCEVEKPSQALQTLQSDLDSFSARDWEKTPRGTDLTLCHMEVLIRQGLLDTARKGLIRLEVSFDDVAAPNILIRTKHFRVLAGLARIWHLMEQWEDVKIYWHKALAFLERNGWTNCFNEAVTLLSLAQILFCQGQTTLAESIYNRASTSLTSEGPKYWIVGLGTYWYNFVAVPLGDRGPNPIVKRRSHVEDLKNLMSQLQIESKDDAAKKAS